MSPGRISESQAVPRGGGRRVPPTVALVGGNCPADVIGAITRPAAVAYSMSNRSFCIGTG